jgi:hypothetical protein
LRTNGIHAERVVDKNAYQSRRRGNLLFRAIDDGLSESQHQEEYGQKSTEKDEQMLKSAGPGGFLLKLLQKANICEKDFLEAPEIEKVNDDRDSQKDESVQGSWCYKLNHDAALPDKNRKTKG